MFKIPRGIPVARHAVCFVLLGWICCSAGLAGTDQQSQRRSGEASAKLAAFVRADTAKRLAASRKQASPQTTDRSSSSESSSFSLFAHQPSVFHNVQQASSPEVPDDEISERISIKSQFSHQGPTQKSTAEKSSSSEKRKTFLHVATAASAHSPDIDSRSSVEYHVNNDPSETDSFYEPQNGDYNNYDEIFKSGGGLTSYERSRASNEFQSPLSVGHSVIEQAFADDDDDEYFFSHEDSTGPRDDIPLAPAYNNKQPGQLLSAPVPVSPQYNSKQTSDSRENYKKTQTNSNSGETYKKTQTNSNSGETYKKTPTGNSGENYKKTTAGNSGEGYNKKANSDSRESYKKSNSKSDERDDSGGYGYPGGDSFDPGDYDAAIIIEDNDVDNYVPFVPHLPPPPPPPTVYQNKPDYVYKFKFYPAGKYLFVFLPLKKLGYHKGAKVIYLDDHDYYHPYYTPSGYESLKTVKKSVSKIQKELKKATKFQPHYDHLYGKGRVKQYLISKPPPHYGPPLGYGNKYGSAKAFHVPHPVTGQDLGGIDDYLNYEVEFDRKQTLQH
ncbi:unnamed protein product [Notodromas monacha]|uniref:Uncharacterized protein n=1 Tax=Notodromas monacha TaxID=399045 RepID=A0A7R9GEC7_9CRUS|nr:unnamed protein product [Notodromas monacha]CAG0918127.1 unnamed protein product [Notodromas monacha]